MGQQGGGVPTQVVGDIGDYFYAFPGRPEAEASYAIIRGIVLVCHRLASILFNPGSTYSYVSTYFST